MTATRLGGLARSTRDLLNTLVTIADREAGFRSLGDTWADSATAHGGLMLTVLGGVAEFEREEIRAGTGERRARAKAREEHMGRPPALTPAPQKEAHQRRAGAQPSRSWRRATMSGWRRFPDGNMNDVVKQRRNRRKEREVSDHALASLHKYYLRAEIMRSEFHKAREQFIFAARQI